MFKGLSVDFAFSKTAFIIGYAWREISHGAESEHRIYLGPFAIVIVRRFDI